MPSPAGPLDRILPPLLADLRTSLGVDLVGVYLYGSAISGGFDPLVSDLDLLVVTARPTEEIDFDVLAGVVRRLQAREPDWADRLDITFVGRPTLADFRSGGQLVEISHEKALARIDDAANWLETWFLARDADTALVGPSPATLIPPIDIREFLLGAALDADRLAALALDDQRPGSVAYRILTMCRALRSLESGAICSKAEGAAWASDRFPAWAPLITAALEVRAGDGARDFTPDDRAAIPHLLAFLAEQIRRTGPPAVPAWER